MKEIPKFVFTILIVCVVSAGILSFLYGVVKENIENQRMAVVNEAIEYVLEDPERTEVIDDGDFIYWRAYDTGGEISGYAVLCAKGGYSSIIQTIVGFDGSGNIKKIKVIDQQETPGLGARMEEVRSNKFLLDVFTGKKREAVDPTPFFQKQFFDSNYKDLKIVATTPTGPGEIEALTGATISSKAVMESIIEGINYVFEKEGIK